MALGQGEGPLMGYYRTYTKHFRLTGKVTTADYKIRLCIRVGIAGISTVAILMQA
jgi:hypothetical protein